MTTAYFLGDSVAGVSPYYPNVMSTRMGWTPTRDQIGGSGFLAGSAGQTYRERLTDCIAAAPDVAVVQGSPNDVYWTNAALAVEFALFFAELRAGLPDAKIYAIAPWPKGAAGLGESKTVMGQYLQTAVQKFTIAGEYLDWTAWLTGTGYEGALAGDGNSDAYIGTDGVHPNAAGAAYLGTRLAFVISPPATGLDF